MSKGNTQIAPQRSLNPLRTAQTLRLAMGGAIIVIAVAGVLAIPGMRMPELWQIAIIVAAAAIAAYVVVDGWRLFTAPYAPRDGASAIGRARATFGTLSLLRCVAAEAPALLGLAFGMAFYPQTAVLPLLGGALSLLILATLAAPNRAFAEKLEQNMNRNGARVPLVADLYHSNRPLDGLIGGHQINGSSYGTGPGVPGPGPIRQDKGGSSTGITINK